MINYIIYFLNIKMITKQNLSRRIIFELLIIVGLWIHTAFFLTIKNDVGKDDCNFDPRDYFTATLIFEIIGNISLTLCFILSGNLLIYYDNNTDFFREDKLTNIAFLELWTMLFFFVCSLLTNITFFKSKYVEGYLETCSNNDAEIAFRIIIFSFAWILFIFYIIIGISLIYALFATIFVALKEANLFNCPNCLKTIFNFRRISPINRLPNDKNIQTEFETSIPITSLKNEIKPFTCMICMSNMINVIIKPCNHICMCHECILKLSKKDCPCCNKPIGEISNIYIANLG